MENYDWNNMINLIKKMDWDDKIIFDLSETTEKKKISVIKSVQYDSYIFKGLGCKNFLKEFINKTDEMGYTRIVQILDDNGYRQFIPIKTWEEFWQIYKKIPIKSRYLFEVIQSDLPCKPYLDIEWKTSDDTATLDHSSFITTLSEHLISLFNTRYNVELDAENILITESHSKHKVSFHVVINKVFSDGSSLCFVTNKKNTMNSAWDVYVGLMENYKTFYDKKIDESVYTLDREFRAIYSNKTKEFRPIVPFCEKIKYDMNIPLDDETCFKYLVTYSKFNKYKAIQTRFESNDLNKMIKYQRSIYCNINKNQDDPKIQKYLSLIKNIHPTAYYTGDSQLNTGFRFSYQDKNEPCYTGNKHDSNGFYITETINGIIKMKCMSEKCKESKILYKPNSKKLFQYKSSKCTNCA